MTVRAERTSGVSKRIDLDALRDNWDAIRRRATAKKILAVVKSDAYGHGLLAAARALRGRADGFAVARTADAAALRTAAVADTASPIVVLQGMATADEAETMAAHGLSPVAHCGWQVAALAALGGRLRGMRVFVKVNTGMNRLGMEAAEAMAAIEKLRGGGADVVVMTHFARADEAGGVAAALERFAAFRRLGLAVSMGNSAATLLAGRVLADGADDWARVGIALYGASPAPQWRSREALGLRAVMTASARLISARVVAAGEAVGYGGDYVAAETMTVGVAGCGYGDGYLRRGGMMAAVGGVVVPLVGRVSMEMIALDLRRAPRARSGDEVVLWGDTPGVDEVAAAANTIAYELLTRI